MGLTETQRLLARLFTDDTLRARFVDDPAAVVAEFGLSPDETKSLTVLPLDQLDDFAGSLIRKRRGEVESLLPATARALGEAQFANLFRRHARGYVPLGIKKHREDALAFARFLGREVADPAWLADLARWEASSWLAYDPARRWTFLRLAHRPVDLLRASSSESSLRPRPTIAVWLRASRNGPLRRFILSRPW